MEVSDDVMKDIRMRLERVLGYAVYTENRNLAMDVGELIGTLDELK